MFFWAISALGFSLLLTTLCLLAAASSASAADNADDSISIVDERFAIHGQLTYVEQETGSFHDPYNGPQNLTPRSGRETVDVTLFAGARLWQGAELWITPEGDQVRIPDQFDR